MIDWLLQYWWAIIGPVGAALYTIARAQADTSNRSFGQRLLYALAPVLDPASSERRQVTPRAIWLAVIGLLIVLLASVLVRLVAVPALQRPLVAAGA